MYQNNNVLRYLKYTHFTCWNQHWKSTMFVSNIDCPSMQPMIFVIALRDSSHAEKHNPVGCTSRGTPCPRRRRPLTSVMGGNTDITWKNGWQTAMVTSMVTRIPVEAKKSHELESSRVEEPQHQMNWPVMFYACSRAWWPTRRRSNSGRGLCLPPKDLLLGHYCARPTVSYLVQELIVPFGEHLKGTGHCASSCELNRLWFNFHRVPCGRTGLLSENRSISSF